MGVFLVMRKSLLCRVYAAGFLSLRALRKIAGIVVEACSDFLFRMPNQRRRELKRRDGKRSTDPSRWFIREEHDLVGILASLIVPSEEDTPGASEVEVLGPSAVEKIDAWVAASARKQAAYSQGLIVFDEMAKHKYGCAFVELPAARQVELLRFVDALYQSRSNSSIVQGRFKRNLLFLYQMWDGSGAVINLFPVLRRDALAAFYMSGVSWLWLGYDGPPMPDGYSNPAKPRPPKRNWEGENLRNVAAGIGGDQRRPAGNRLRKNHLSDVVVIGSGAGGAVVAKELGEAGLSVVVLEAGKRYNPPVDYLTDRTDFEVDAAKVFEPDDELRDLYTTGRGNRFSYNRAKGVGGSTLKYEAMSPRFHESDFRVRSEDGVADNWPLSYADLEPYYARVEYELGVSGPNGADANPFDPPRSRPFPTPPHPLNLASQAVRHGAGKLGLHFVREPLAIPSEEWNGRPACIGAGTCMLGCAISAKSSMDVTYLSKAEATGKIEIRPRCTACEIVMGRDGNARGVVYFDKDGRKHEVRARAIVLAGNAVETPRLLLMSSSSRFPHGLANSSGLVGKYFTEHLAVFARGVFPERLDPWRGTPTGGMIQDYYATNQANGFARGWTVLVTTIGPWPFSTAERTPGWGPNHKKEVQSVFGHTVCLASIGEQLPSLKNQVTLDPVMKDNFGMPVPHLVNEARENDREMITAISGSLLAILEAAGATRILENGYLPGGSSHYFGTCRMGSNPENSVVDAWGRTHDVSNLFIADGSVFVTGGAVNPALTISALAARTAEGIICAFGRREL
jgi:choline dehydrogenase-like flavoprotein